MLKKLKQQYSEYYFIIQLLLLFILFYYSFELCIALSSKGGLYSSFVEQYFNIVHWYRQSILQASKFVSNILGYKATIISSTRILGFNNFSVTLIYSCLGYGVSSFWAAFILSFPTHRKKRLWLIVGLIIIWCVNVMRIVILLTQINIAQSVHQFSNHHFIYNVVVYGIVLLMIYFYTKKKMKINK